MPGLFPPFKGGGGGIRRPPRAPATLERGSHLIARLPERLLGTGDRGRAWGEPRGRRVGLFDLGGALPPSLEKPHAPPLRRWGEDGAEPWWWRHGVDREVPKVGVGGRIWVGDGGVSRDTVSEAWVSSSSPLSLPFVSSLGICGDILAPLQGRWDPLWT